TKPRKINDIDLIFCDSRARHGQCRTVFVALCYYEQPSFRSPHRGGIAAMTNFMDWLPQGVIPAVLLPFKPDFSIDAAAYRKHLHDVAAVDGVSALTVNGHSCEVHACNLDEQREVMRLTMDELGDRLPIIAGVYADGSLEAARITRHAEADGATALLVFPPQSMSMGGQLRPEMALAHFSTIAAATSLPLICFNY